MVPRAACWVVDTTVASQLEEEEQLDPPELCAVCLDCVPSEVLDPCSHRFCAACVSQLRTCPLCRATITNVRAGDGDGGPDRDTAANIADERPLAAALDQLRCSLQPPLQVQPLAHSRVGRAVPGTGSAMISRSTTSLRSDVAPLLPAQHHRDSSCRYVTATGQCWHARDDCRGLRNARWVIDTKCSPRQLHARGLRPCTLCGGGTPVFGSAPAGTVSSGGVPPETPLWAAAAEVVATISNHGMRRQPPLPQPATSNSRLQPHAVRSSRCRVVASATTTTNAVASAKSSRQLHTGAQPAAAAASSSGTSAAACASVFFVTATGRKYHSTASCAGLRAARRVWRGPTGGREPCRLCCC